MGGSSLVAVDGDVAGNCPPTGGAVTPQPATKKINKRNTPNGKISDQLAQLVVFGVSSKVLEKRSFWQELTLVFLYGLNIKYLLTYNGLNHQLLYSL